ncbi:MAG: DUF3606 domain-containing protein [Betaproteobacteria bacterium]
MAGPTDKRATTPQRSNINVSENWQVQYWTTRFRVTEAELLTAISLVGNAAADIRQHFGVPRSKGRWP